MKENTQMVQQGISYAGLLRISLIEDMLKHFDECRKLKKKRLCRGLLAFDDQPKDNGLALALVWILFGNHTPKYSP